MQCERLIKQIKTWYMHVKDETMAPARMVSFMEQHIEDCEICRQDPDVKAEIAKITEIILPESKIPKAVRQQAQKEKEEAEKEAEENGADEVDEVADEDEDQDALEINGEDLDSETSGR
jgi:hypothetical protein